MIAHEAIVNRLLWMQEAYGLTAADRVLHSAAGDAYSFEETAEWLLDAGFAGVRPLEVPGPAPIDHVLPNPPIDHALPNPHASPACWNAGALGSTAVPKANTIPRKTKTLVASWGGVSEGSGKPGTPCARMHLENSRNAGF